MKKTLAVFAWSNELSEELKKETDIFLVQFLKEYKNKVEKVLFGGGAYWVMWQLKDKCQELWIDIIGYSLERYRKKDSWNWNIWFDTDNERVRSFYEDWDSFLALPWGLWTIREVLDINTRIKDCKTDKRIYIPKEFQAFFDLVKNLELSWMLAQEDLNNIKIMDSYKDFEF